MSSPHGLRRSLESHLPRNRCAQAAFVNEPLQRLCAKIPSRRYGKQMRRAVTQAMFRLANRVQCGILGNSPEKRLAPALA